MLKYKIHSTFIVFISIYIITLLVRSYADSTFIKYYLTDLCFIPVLLSGSVITTSYIKNRKKLLLLSPLQIGVVILCVSIYFEWYLPSYKKEMQHTSDNLDVLMYFIGGIIFWLIQKLKI